MTGNPGPSLFWLTVRAIWWRDCIRFFRQRNRVISALATPIVFWLLLGSGFSGSFVPPGADQPQSYLAYFFPGSAALIMLFTAIFSTISVIEDRREGVLQAVLASPAPRDAIVLGKLLGGTTLSAAQALVFCLLAPAAGIPITFNNLLPLLTASLLAGFALTGLGFVFAWPLDSTMGFHALMNIFLMPLWMLSGALFPAAPGSGWVWWAQLVNPVSYSVAALRHALSPDPWAPLPGLPGFSVSLAVTAVFGALLFVAGCLLARTKQGPVQ